jgi:hypothetical protein
MRTALISDTHLGSVGGEDVLREAVIRERLWEEIATADRVVLLGDTVELRDLPLEQALEASRPFFEELGEATSGAEVLLVPGNHDNRFAEPLLDSVRLESGGRLGLEHRGGPADSALARIDEWLGGGRLGVAYPGAWLREDVYAMHGHYLDCHLTLPRAESVGANLLMRLSSRPPDPAEPADYERVLRPLYGLIFALAQSENHVAGGASRLSESAWDYMRSNKSGRGAAAGRLVARGAVPAAVWTLNRLLGSDFEPDLTPQAITRSSVTAAAETVRRLRIAAPHVICGHTHRGGPHQGEDDWPLPGGGELHNTGNWVFTRALHRNSSGPGPYWPGTVTWVEEEGGDPRRVRLLDSFTAEELAAIAEKGRIPA